MLGVTHVDELISPNTGYIVLVSEGGIILRAFVRTHRHNTGVRRTDRQTDRQKCYTRS